MLYGIKNSKTGKYYNSYEGYVTEPFQCSFFVSNENATKRIRDLKRGSVYFRENKNDIDDLVVVTLNVLEVPTT